MKTTGKITWINHIPQTNGVNVYKTCLSFISNKNRSNLNRIENKIKLEIALPKMVKNEYWKESIEDISTIDHYIILYHISSKTGNPIKGVKAESLYTDEFSPNDINPPILGKLRDIRKPITIIVYLENSELTLDMIRSIQERTIKKINDPQQDSTFCLDDNKLVTEDGKAIPDEACGGILQ